MDIGVTYAAVQDLDEDIVPTRRALPKPR